jgi:hypothetical protein
LPKIEKNDPWAMEPAGRLAEIKLAAFTIPFGFTIGPGAVLAAPAAWFTV